MLDCQKHLFDLSDEVTYLNCAYMGPMLRAVEAVGQRELKRRMQPYNYGRSDFFEPVQQLKASYAQFINADDPERIAIIPSASYGLSNAAQNIDYSEKKDILLIGEQFPSNYYPWERAAKQFGANIKFVESPSDGKDRPAKWNQAILDQIDQHTAVVSMAHVHWADGTLYDLIAVREKTKAFGAKLVLDGTQSVGALPFDIQTIQPDALIVAGYKWLFGPYGLGLAYYGPAFDDGQAIEENWINRKDSHIFENLVNYQSAYKPKAARYNMGEQSNFIYIEMLRESLRQLSEWGPQRIQNYCKGLVMDYLPQFEELGFQTGLGTQMAYHLCGIRLPENIKMDQLQERLKEEQIFVSMRGNAIRLAPNVYNEPKDMDRLLSVFKQMVR